MKYHLLYFYSGYIGNCAVLKIQRTKAFLF